jgi:hypothetical protein
LKIGMGGSVFILVDHPESQISTISFSACDLSIRNWIGGSRSRKCPQPQHAAITDAARQILAAVA